MGTPRFSGYCISETLGWICQENFGGITLHANVDVSPSKGRSCPCAKFSPSAFVRPILFSGPAGKAAGQPVDTTSPFWGQMKHSGGIHIPGMVPIVEKHFCLP